MHFLFYPRKYFVDHGLAVLHALRSFASATKIFLSNELFVLVRAFDFGDVTHVLDNNISARTLGQVVRRFVADASASLAIVVGCVVVGAA